MSFQWLFFQLCIQWHCAGDHWIVQRPAVRLCSHCHCMSLLYNSPIFKECFAVLILCIWRVTRCFLGSFLCKTSPSISFQLLDYPCTGAESQDVLWVHWPGCLGCVDIFQASCLHMTFKKNACHDCIGHAMAAGRYVAKSLNVFKCLWLNVDQGAQ